MLIGCTCKSLVMVSNGFIEITENRRMFPKLPESTALRIFTVIALGPIDNLPLSFLSLLLDGWIVKLIALTS